ncbi:prepilin-type N-terminal cleavage/methylation domain-containing protein [Candidatus Giovannonibacteria bacterium]|nr:prepilin-type N-terminal cleavage/methylation domain-containing protein [Candidatus Giovannonibacteria bacterium]
MLFRMKNKGFTLLELIIAVSIFTIFTVIIMSSFLNLSSVQKNITNKQEVLSKLRSALELMGKEISSGGSAFPSGCENGCNSFVFATKLRPDVPLRRVEYGLNVNGIMVRGEQKTYGLCATIPLAASCYQPLTQGIKLNNLKFFVSNKAVYLQPIVTVTLDGIVAPGTKQQEAFQLSSTFSPRLLQDPNAVPPQDNVPPAIQITAPTSASTYTTASLSVPLGGTASDNVAVTEVIWRNQTTGSSGFAIPDAAGYAFWHTAGITISPAVDNTLIVEARDAEGNLASDTLTIVSTAPPPAPSTPTITDGYAYCSCGVDMYAFIQWTPSSATHYHIERCLGSGCIDFAEVNSRDYEQNWDPFIENEFYSYRVRAHDHIYDTYSDYSNVFTFFSGLNTCGGVNLCCNWNGIQDNGETGVDCGGGNCSACGPACNSNGIQDNGETGVDCGGGGCASCGALPPAESFTLSANPIYVRVGVTGGTSDPVLSATDSTITVTPINGFSNTVSLSASGGPVGMQAFFGDSNLSSSEYSSGSSFYVKIPNNTGLGQYDATVTGAGGGASDGVTVTIIVEHSEGGVQ